MRQLAQDPGNIIIASLRNLAKSAALEDAKASAKADLHILELDVGDEASVKEAYAVAERILCEAGGLGLDYLINNAGTVRVYCRHQTINFKHNLCCVWLG